VKLVSNPLEEELDKFRKWRTGMFQQFGIRTWDSLFTISRCTSCGRESVAGIGSVVGIEFGRFDRLESQLLKMLNPTSPCKKCQGQTHPIGLLYCTYYPETKADLQVLLKRESDGSLMREFAKVTLDGKISMLGAITSDQEFGGKFGVPFSIRGEWAKIARESSRTQTPQFLLVQDGYMISFWPSSISQQELESVRKSIDNFAQKNGLDFGDYLSNGPKRNVEVKESFEAWLDDFADQLRKGEFQAFGLVSSTSFINHAKREFSGYSLEFPQGFHPIKAPMFRCRRGDFYLEASVASYLVTAIHRGLSFARVGRGFLATALLDRIDLMVELFEKLRPIFQDYKLIVEGGRVLVLQEKSSDERMKSWDLYEFADESTADFPRFLREKMGYDLIAKKFV